MPALPRLPASRCGVVTLAELLRAGWTPDAVRHALQTGRLERVAASRFAPPPSPDLNRFQQADLRLLRRVIAATVPGDRVAVSHLAGALHRGWPVWADDPHSCVATWDFRIRRVTGMHVHRVDRAALVRRGGLPITSATRTLVDVAREFGPAAGMASGDAALRRGEVGLDALTAEVARCAGLAGIGNAAAMLPLLDPLAESPLESRSRWCFHTHGVDQPTSQVWIYTREGRFLGRADHYWSEGVVGEADGTLKYLDPDDPYALVKEKKWQEGFASVELETARWGAKDLKDFSQAAARIGRARIRAVRRRADGPQLWVAVPSAPIDVHDPGPLTA